MLRTALRRAVAPYWSLPDLSVRGVAQAAYEPTGSNLQLPEFAFVPPPYTGPSKDEVMKLRATYLSPGACINLQFPQRLTRTSRTISVVHAALSFHFKKPVMIVDGKMQYLFDEEGRRYLDVRDKYRCPQVTAR